MTQILIEGELEDRTECFWHARQLLVSDDCDAQRRRDALRILAVLSRFDPSQRLRRAASRTLVELRLEGALHLLADNDAMTKLTRSSVEWEGESAQ
ncbi:MAG: hypothetical protein MI920_17940 [Kiloniellales bacterium]|nr:hypothetical protein [Kiloniellales bacterium]